MILKKSRIFNGYRRSTIWDEFLLQIFFRIKKCKIGTLQRRIGRYRVTPGYDFTVVQKRMSEPVFSRCEPVFPLYLLIGVL